MIGEPKKVTIVGSGNWGSAIARIVGVNVKDSTEFNSRVPMYVYEELVNGRKLTEIINTEHINHKYLPGIRLPDNVVALSDIRECVQGADILVFVVPHQFLRNICKLMRGHLKPTTVGISLIKGVDVTPGQPMRLISDVVREELDIPCASLMGANLAVEVVQEFFCEATIGCWDMEVGHMLKRLFQTDYFRLVVVQDAAAVELCGALKNIIATGAGFSDGLGYGNNTKAAVIRLGLMEMVKFVKELYPESKLDTFFESCGIADLITTSMSGRNTTVAKAFAASRGKRSISELENELLNGQKLQGVPTAAEVNMLLRERGLEDSYPLFTAVHRIAIGQLPVDCFIDCLKSHPAHC